MGKFLIKSRNGHLMSAASYVICLLYWLICLHQSSVRPWWDLTWWKFLMQKHLKMSFVLFRTCLASCIRVIFLYILSCKTSYLSRRIKWVGVSGNACKAKGVSGSYIIPPSYLDQTKVGIQKATLPNLTLPT